MVLAGVRASPHVDRQHQVLGDPHRVEAEFLGADGELLPQAGVNAAERDSDLHSADVTQGRAPSEVLLLFPESVILRRGHSSVWRMTASGLRLRYAVALALAQLLAGVELTVLVMPLRHDVVPDAASVFGRHTLIAAVGLAIVGITAVVAYAVAVVDGKLRWFITGRPPAPRDRAFVRRLLRNQSAMLAAIWAVSGIVLFAVNRPGGAAAAWLIAMCMLFGATTSTGAALLLMQRLMRPIVAAATSPTGRDTAPGVMARLLLMWLMSSALPTIGIAMVVVMRSQGWIIEKKASVELPVVVLSLISVLVGLRGMMIVAMSVSDPVRDVVEAMAKVEHGEIDTEVDVYERSEIGRLQSGFNRMVAGLAERDRLRDVFGRHVGTDVARRALSGAGTLTGEVREAAVLYVDLVGSTQLARAGRPPRSPRYSTISSRSWWPPSTNGRV